MNNSKTNPLKLWFSLILIYVLCGAVSYAQENVDNSGWLFRDAEVELISPEVAEAQVSQAQEDRAAHATAAVSSSVSTQSAAITITPEIRELARGLQHDPLLIYRHVKDHIDYVPYYGYLKGPTLTWLERSGNDFDQAALMIALLRASGFDANFAFGTMTIPTHGAYQDKDLAHWFGVDADNGLIVSVIASGGIPASINGDSVEMRRVWVEANINGDIVQLDPAFKIYDQVEGIDVGEAMGFDQAALSAAASGIEGQSNGVPFVRNLDETAINSKLTDFTTQFVNEIRANHANKSIEEILGSYQIRTETIEVLPRYPEFSFVKDATWVSVPQQYIHTFQVELAGLRETLNFPEIAGKKLTLGFPSLNAQSAAFSTSQALTERDQDAEAPFIFELPDAETLAQAGYVEGNVITDESSLTITDEVQVQEGVFTEENEITPKLDSVLSENAVVAPDTVANNTNGLCVSAGVRYLGQYRKLRCEYKNTYTRFGRGATLTIRQIARSPEHRNRFVELSGFNLPFTLAPGQSRFFEVLYKADQVGNPHTQVYQLAGSYRVNSGGISATGGFSSQTFYFNGATVAFPKGQLSLDDRVLFNEVTAQPGAKLNKLGLYINHPYSARSGTYADQYVEYDIKRGGNYVILTGFGQSHAGKLLEKRQRSLQKLQEVESNSSIKLITETLNVVGQSWMRELTLSNRIICRIAELNCFSHHQVGLMAQEEGFYIDVKAIYFEALARSLAARENDGVKAAVRSSVFLGSALEHGVIEQSQDVKAVSTIKLLKRNNDNANNKLFQINKNQWSSAKSQLRGYASAQLQVLENFVNTESNAELLLPQQGGFREGDWTGYAYIGNTRDGNDTGHLMAIGGDYEDSTARLNGVDAVLIAANSSLETRVMHGGNSIAVGNVNAAQLNNRSFNTWLEPGERYHTTGIDPVDFVTGAFLYDLPTLSVGAAEPWGMSVLPTYSSISRNVDDKLGHGWDHNYQVRINNYSDHVIGLGGRSALDAAPAVVSAYVTLSYMSQDSRSAKDWLTAGLVTNWQMDQLTERSYAVNFEHAKLSFTRLPDGSYVPPPGTTMSLSGDMGSFILEGRFGPTLLFDAKNRIKEWKDVDNNTLTFEYLGDDLKTIIDAAGRTLTFDYTNNRIRKIQDMLGRKIEFGYSSSGNMTSFTDVLGGVWTLSYDSDHNLLSVTNPLGVLKVRNRYDSLGRVYEQDMLVQDGEIGLYQVLYAGFSTTEIDPHDQAMVYYFDHLDRQVAVENTLGYIGNVVLDGQNQIVSQVDALGRKTKSEYDEHNNMTAMIDALNQRTEMYYDAEHRLIETINASGHKTNVTYDAEHHPLTSTVYPSSGASITTQNSYYPDGFLYTSTDGNGVVTTTTYDQYNYMDTVQVSGRPKVNYDYDALGRLIKFTDQEDSEYSFRYNDAGQLLERIDPLGKKTIHEYDVMGRKVKIKDRNGDITTFNYTPNNLTERVNYADGSSTDYVYNIRNELVSMTDTIGSSNYSYDALGRLQQFTDAQGFEIGYEYDAVGNIIQLRYPGNDKSVNYYYDDLNRLIAVTNWLGETMEYSYDALSRLETIKHFNGAVSSYVFDDANRLLNIITSKSDGLIIHRQKFTLDDNGNTIREFKEQPQVPYEEVDSVSYGYDAKKQRLLNIGVNNATILSYDDEGQLQQKGNEDYIFNVRYQLSSLSRNGIDSVYEYDGSGERLKATRGSETTLYIYDARGNLLGEANENKQISRYYIYGLGLTALVEDNNSYVYHFDANGSTMAITDKNLNIINQYSYSPYGRNLGRAEQINQPFTYSGQSGVMEEQVDLYFARARYYDAEVGRFLSEDPLGLEAGVNVYGYVEGNPITYVDPSGLDKAARAIVVAYQIGDTVSDFIAPGKALFKSVFKRTIKESSGPAINNATKIKLNKQLASQEQVSQISTGKGIPIAGAGTSKELRDANRLSDVYGGTATDWQKVKSANRSHIDGYNQETHAYQNINTGQIVELKTKIEGH